MKKLFIVLVFGFSSLGLVSQSTHNCPSVGTGTSGGNQCFTGSIYSAPSNTTNYGRSNDLVNKNYYANVKRRYRSINGSPYVYDEKTKGDLVLNNNFRIENLNLKYDAYEEEIILTNNKGEDIVLESDYYKELILKTDGGEKVFRKIGSDAKAKFAEVLYEDEDIVFFKNLKKIMRISNRRNLSRFVHRSKYYISNGKDHIAKLNLKKSDIFKHLPQEKANEYREYVAQNDITLKKEKDYLAMFATVE